MSKRFTPWLVLACIGALAGCTSGSGDPAGNTELNVLIPSGSSQSGPGAPQAFDIQVVEYTINCSDGIDFDPTSDPDIDSGPILNNDVVINGVLEVLDSPNPGVSTQDFGPDLGEVYVFQGLMDLPQTVGCSAQLRARDLDGEIICTATETFDINADALTTVNILMFCGISYQAPVGMLDINADFSFNVANYCPDLFILNCIDSELDVRTIPGVGDVLATACQVRFRDADSQCGNSCDPQQEIITPTGIDVLPGPDPGQPSTRVTCASTQGACAISCNGATPAAFCDFTGDTLGNIGDPPPGPLAPGIGGFFVTCATFDNDGDPTTPEVPVTPGDTIQCVATTTDGDVDCDKTKTVDLTIAGLSPCQTFASTGGVCTDGNPCTDDVCDDGTCDGATAAACCTFPNSPAGATCQIGALGGECDGSGTCVLSGCQGDDANCELDGNECTAPPTGACQPDGSCLPEQDVTNGTACAGNTGTCQNGSCVDNCDISVVDCSDGLACTQDLCDNSTNPGTCSNPAGNEGNICDTTSGAPGSCSSTTTQSCGADADCPAGETCEGDGTCQAGSCEPPPVVDNCAGGVEWQAVPQTCPTAVYDAATTTCTCPGGTVDPVPGGGNCGAFNPPPGPVVGGCEAPGGVLNTQLALDTLIQLSYTSTADGNVTHAITISATNPTLVQAPGLVTLDQVDVYSSVTNATPNQLVNQLDQTASSLFNCGNFCEGPPNQGAACTRATQEADCGAATTCGCPLLLGVYTQGSATLLLSDPDMPVTTTPVTPIDTALPVELNYQGDDAALDLVLTIVASGDALPVSGAACTFNNPNAGQGDPLSCPVL